jgi:apolipoprotein N-acyltransferase
MEWNRLKTGKFPWWLAGAVLYGISWPMPWNANLSFLAWFALVFLFFSLEKSRGFWRFMGTAWAFTLVAYTICSGWFLDIPTNKVLIGIGALTESFSLPLPFIPFYFIQKKAGFRQSVFILPFLFVLGEWAYCSLEHNLSFLLVAHSQTANLWLIQYADLFGFLSVTFWVILFNSLLYSAIVRSGYNPFSATFIKRAVPAAALMVSVPLAYAVFRHHRLQERPADRMRITMINTRFAPNPKTAALAAKNLDRTVELTDSVDFYSRKAGLDRDLIVWHEGAIPMGNDPAIRRFIQDAVDDWRTPLLSGIEFQEKFENTRYGQPVNRVVLFTPGPLSSDSMQFYDKIGLAPGWESIPYLSLFHKAGIRFRNEHQFHKKGDRIRLFDIPGRTRHFTIGAPVCFEQNISGIWNRMTRLGAEGFVQVSFESWFGKTYFQKQVAYITRLRAIETRRGVARCSNGGLTFFADPFGRIYSRAHGSESAATDDLVLSKTMSFYTLHPGLFPLICGIVSIAAFVLALVRPRRLPRL